MTILEKIHKLFKDKKGITLDEQQVTTIKYSPMSVELILILENGEEDTLELSKSYFWKKPVPSDEVTEIILQEDLQEFPVIEPYKEYGREYTRILSRYSEYTRGHSSSHEDLEPSPTTSKEDRYKDRCIFCGRTSYSVQGNFNKSQLDYTDEYRHKTTGKTCLCLKSELYKEHEYKKRLLESKHHTELMELKDQYDLQPNVKAFLDLEIKVLTKKLEKIDSGEFIHFFHSEEIKY